MNVLGIDVGSSSVKAGVLRDGAVVGELVREGFPTRYDGPRVEVDAANVLAAVSGAIKLLGEAAKSADVIALSVMAPSWVALDKNDKPLTPIITHQDRRSVQIARDLESRVGKARHLKLAGNRPFPGGISSTTAAWYKAHAPGVMKKSALVGHLSTLLIKLLTGARATDPSNASFTGLYNTLTLKGWNDELCDAAGVSPKVLPDVIESSAVAGNVTAAAAQAFGLREGTPVLAGCMDTSAALLLIDTKPGQLLNVVGSTDVLALCVDKPKPHERLLTRAVGVGRRWMSVSTLAAAGSSLAWVKDQLFADLDLDAYRALMQSLTRPTSPREVSRAYGHDRGGAGDHVVKFEPYLAGERVSIEQRQGAFTGLTLSTTRQEMLRAVIESLAVASAARLELIAATNASTTIARKVMLTGGVQAGLAEVMHRDWPKGYKFFHEDEATLRGLAKLVR
jgi:xylulokinase